MIGLQGQQTNVPLHWMANFMSSGPDQFVNALSSLTRLISALVGNSAYLVWRSSFGSAWALAVARNETQHSFLHESRRHVCRLCTSHLKLVKEREVNRPATRNQSNQKGPQNKAKKLDDEWPESIFHHVGSQSASHLSSVRCEVLRRFSC